MNGWVGADILLTCSAVCGMQARGGANFERDVYFMDVHLLEVSVSTMRRQCPDEDSFTFRWTELVCTGHAPSKRSGIAASLLPSSNILVAFGGGTLWSNGVVHNDVHTLDVSSRHWVYRETSGERPPARQGHAALTMEASGTDIFYIGGSNNVDVFDDMHILNTKTWTFSRFQHPTCPFNSLAGLSVDRFNDIPDGKVIVFGGASWQDTVATVSADVFELDLAAGVADIQWTTKTQSQYTRGKKRQAGSHWPHSRFSHATCFVDHDHLLVHGGWGFIEMGDGDDFDYEGDIKVEGGDDIFFGQFKIYNTLTNTWSYVKCESKLNHPQRFGHKMFCLHHLGVVIGMCGNNGLHPLDDIFLLSLHAPESLGVVPMTSSNTSGSRLGGLLDDYYQPESMGQQFRNFLNNGLFADVKIEVSGCSCDIDVPQLPYPCVESCRVESVTLHAHRCVLAARSEVFAVMLRPSFKESYDGVIRVANTTPSIFEIFLQCVYGADVFAVLSFDNLLGVLDLANRYIVLDLKYDCESSLCMQANADNVVSLIGYANQFSCPYLLRRCLEVIKKSESRVEISEKIEVTYPELAGDIRLFIESHGFQPDKSEKIKRCIKKRRYTSESSTV